MEPWISIGFILVHWGQTLTQIERETGWNHHPNDGKLPMKQKNTVRLRYSSAATVVSWSHHYVCTLIQYNVLYIMWCMYIYILYIYILYTWIYPPHSMLMCRIQFPGFPGLLAIGVVQAFQGLTQRRADDVPERMPRRFFRKIHESQQQKKKWIDEI